MLGPCQKRQSNGDVDGCQQFEQSTDAESKFCDACGCHRAFHSHDHILTMKTTPHNPETATNSPVNYLASLAHVTASMSHVDETGISTSPHNVTTNHPRPRSSNSTISNNSANTTSNNSETHQQSNFPEYPDGDMSIEIDAHECDDYGNTGWATFSFSSWKLKSERGKARKLRCLGVLVCSHSTACNYVVRPSQNVERLNRQLQMQGTRCEATMTWKEYYSSSNTMKHLLLHNNQHNHPKPPSIRPPPSAFRRFEQQVLNAPSYLPKQMLIGTSFTSSVRSIHP